MKQSLNRDTLAYQVGMRPALQYRDMSAMLLPPVVKAITSVLQSTNIFDVVEGQDAGAELPLGSPEKDAVIFYLLNHAVTLIRQKVHVYEPLGAYLPILEQYHVELAARATRMFSYLLLICTRESRHDHSNLGDSPYATLKNTYGKQIIDFHQSLKGKSSLGAAEVLQKSPPQVPLGKYVNFLSDIFYKGSYGSSYGGAAWGKVADVLRDFVHGKITAEMMMDTSFTLCHNNGPIFNKAMLFDTYSAEIYKILDVQRSGQVPQLIADNQTPYAKDVRVSSIWHSCHDVLGGAFDGPVDWFLVEELGAVKTYPDQKTKQIAKYGYPSKFKAKKEAEQAKAEVTAKAMLEKFKSSVEIIPGEFIQKTKRPS